MEIANIRTTGTILGVAGLLVGASAGSEANPPSWPDSVSVFTPSMSSAEIEEVGLFDIDQQPLYLILCFIIPISIYMCILK